MTLENIPAQTDEKIGPWQTRTITLVVLIGILLVGALVRFVDVLAMDISQSYELGGLFAEFSKQIIANGYRLPERIPYYSDGGIPFAYPPLPFYVAAVPLDLFSLPENPWLNLLVPLVATLTLPAFWVLTGACRFNRLTRLAALTAFALMPVVSNQLHEVGGMAEAFGTLALIGFAWSLLRATQQPSPARFGWIAITWAGCIVASPGSAYASAPTAALFLASMLAARDAPHWRRTLAYFLVAAVGAAALSSVYWLTVIHYHGVDVFVDSVKGQYGSSILSTLRTRVKRLMLLQFSDSQYPVVWDACIVFGAIYAVLKKARWDLSAWLIMLWMIPREGPWMAGIPAALLAGQAAGEVFIPALDQQVGRIWRAPDERTLHGLIMRLSSLAVIGFLLFPLGFDTYAAVRNAGKRAVIPEKVVEGLEWVDDNLPEDAVLIVVYNQILPDWAPHYARRTVLNMAFGTEWKRPQRENARWFEKYSQVCTSFDCVRETAHTIGYDYDEFHLVLSPQFYEQFSGQPPETPQTEFRIEYQNEDVIIGFLSSRVPE